MPNPFFMQKPQQVDYGNFRDAYKMFASSKNPMELFMNMAKRNPNLQPIMNAIQGGANPQQLFNSLCQQRGINPQEFLKNITG